MTWGSQSSNFVARVITVQGDENLLKLFDWSGVFGFLTAFIQRLRIHLSLSLNALGLIILHQLVTSICVLTCWSDISLDMPISIKEGKLLFIAPHRTSAM